jgi:NAD(P)-dependent dehydrogenase (short-subunit alcohol dehydrogenase family)
MAKPLYVVTGGSAGLGLQASLALARTGATVLLAARNAERLAAAVERVGAEGAAAGGAAVGLRLDTSSLADVQRFAAEFDAKFPGAQVGNGW